MRSWSGIAPASTCEPTSLSSALCRPTSSRIAISSPFGAKRPAACSPPVSSNAFWAARSRSGSARITARATTGPSGRGSDRRATSSIDALPQIPHDAVATKCRSATFESSNGRESRTTIVSSGWLSDPGSPPAVEMTSGPSMSPSVRRKPTASSSSKPGVRIVTATATGSCCGPAARISSGASPTTRSSRISSEVPRTAMIRWLVTWRIGSSGSSVMGMSWPPAPGRTRPGRRERRPRPARRGPGPRATRNQARRHSRR